MAKYKFTKTIKPTEGICIDADGTVTKLPSSSIRAPKHAFVPGAAGIPCGASSSQMRGRAHKHDKWSRPKGFVAPNYGTAGMSLTPRSKPIMTIPLSSRNNPYYGEKAIHDIPPARPCGMFGLSRPKPVSRTAAMSFQSHGE